MKIIFSRFIEFSSYDHNAWQLLENQRINHSTFGTGVIKNIQWIDDNKDKSSATIQFDNQVKSILRGLTNILNISLKVFDGKIITELSISNDLLEKIETFEKLMEQKKFQLELESESRNEFKFRKAKYFVSWYKDNSPLSELNKILISLDEGNKLSDIDEQWLISQRLFPVLGIYYEKKGNLSKAGSNWRKSNDPQRALNITENLDNKDHYILTTRGAAYRDLNDLEKATESANLAINISPDDFHPYNLLGAIFCQQGLPEIGLSYFEKAISLGSKPPDEVLYLKSALKEAGNEERLLVANFLLQKNPEKYGWVKFYIE